MSLHDVTLLIPLYRSRRHLPRVFENIDSHVQAGAYVLCSDEHCLDDAVDEIQERYKQSLQVSVLRSTKGGNWVSNCNRLLDACTTPFFRITPHDDTVGSSATEVLVSVIRADPKIAVSHGWVYAETESGERLSERDEPKFPLRPFEDPLIFSAGFFWQGLFSGAFKAVLRRNVFNNGPLFIKPTKNLKHSERAWLFGYSLLGDFSFSSKASLVKRYWDGSLTSDWKLEKGDMISVAEVMASYVDDLVTSEETRAALRFNLFLNAVRRENWIDGLCSSYPRFDAALIEDPPAKRAPKRRLIMRLIKGGFDGMQPKKQSNARLKLL